MIISQNITMEGFKRYLKQTKTIVFPFGTIEEHGSHLPLNTDSLIIQEVLKLVAKKKKFFLAPIVHYGVCTTTREHPGTISITPETPNDYHAGELETSVVLYLFPELVKGRAKEEYPKIPKPFVIKDKMKYWPGGVWGDPQKASAEKGRKAIELMVDKIAEIIEQIEKPF